ncbi:quinolinate synthase [Paenibacillus marinisediminis]
MKKLRWIPMLTATAVSVALLFGGWFLFRDQVKEAPLQSTLASLPQVAASDVQWQPKQLVITLDLEPDADLRDVVQKAYTEALKQAEERNISIVIKDDHTTDKLEDWWSRALFPVAEAMAHQEFSNIPNELDQLAKTVPGLSVKTEMDEHFVYITLKEEQGTKMIVLPLQGERMGVWPNAEEQKIVA